MHPAVSSTKCIKYLACLLSSILCLFVECMFACARFTFPCLNSWQQKNYGKVLHIFHWIFRWIVLKKEMESASTPALVKTTNANLQRALERWVTMVDAALREEVGSRRREVAIQVFVRTFVPTDVEEEDIAHFSNNLISDEVSEMIHNLLTYSLSLSFHVYRKEFFVSLHRDLHCCSSGELVETIEGDQTRRAVFTILPTPGTCERQLSSSCSISRI